ncbi:MAG: PKD domain-containing protein [Planctomycetes bacterium]|nr:PKD domain-containing protein [Planctomycetota bacterium]
MKPSARLVLSLAVIGAIAAVNSCSSGLGHNLPPAEVPPVAGSNGNLPVGIDLGVVPTDAATGAVIAGLVVPAIGSTPARDVVLVAFATAADAADADGSGTPLSRDTVTDGNGVSDVFVAAVSAQDVETRAFSQSLAGKFRHPRCATCHSMQAADTTAFVSAAATGQPHAGPAPGPTFPNNAPEICADCHASAASTTFPVPRWQAPAASFDLRRKSVAELAVAAQNVPADEPLHFVTDPRVLWALDSGVLPFVQGRNGRADDDQDGIDEPEDRDGTKRTVPGGSATFIQQIQDWKDSGMVVTAADAVRDVTLVSRAAGGTAAGNGASSAARVLWVANPAFNPSTAVTAAATNPIGTLFVAFQSEADDLAGTDGNGASDVFRVAIELRAEENANGAAEAGGLNLEFAGTTLCSATSGTTTAGDGASTNPSIGGDDGQFIAFQSTSSDLVASFNDQNGAAADVFVRWIGPDTTALISHDVGDTTSGGSGASERPRLDPAGVVVAFESDAADLIVGDANGVRDVYFARIDGGTPFTKVRASVTATGAEGSGGASTNATVHETGGRVRVAFESTATDLANGLVAASNVYLFDSDSGTTTLLNQRLAPGGDAIGDGDAHDAVIADDGSAVVFDSEAGNIDVLRESDLNHAADVFLVETAQLAQGKVLPFRISLTVTEATDGNGASTNPHFGSFRGASSQFTTGFAVYQTTATNLGTSDSTALVVTFLSETSGVLADFTATPTSGVAPVTVQFTDTSAGLPSSWAWDFDNDGNVDSTEQNPSFTFETPGYYTVKLVASNGNSDGEVVKTDFVRAIGPVAPDFSATPTSGPGQITSPSTIGTPLSVQFTDLSTEEPTSWEWDLDGDDVTDSTDQNPLFSYTTPGTYTVKLTATNEAGTESVTKTDFITVFTPVHADFTRTPTSGFVPFQVAFTDASVGATSWAWDFDGDTVVDSTDQNPSFDYTIAGIFDVTLTATGPGGTDTFTFNNCVQADGAVSASFTLSASSAYTNQTINLDASGSSGTISLYEWDFDNNFATVEVSTVSPTVNGVGVGANFPSSSQTAYTIRLRVTGSGGDQATASLPFTSVATSETVVLTATQDSTIYSNPTSQGNGNGGGTMAVVGRTWVNGVRRALVQFDVSSIPSAVTINTATLRLLDTSPTGSPIGGSAPGGTTEKLRPTQTFDIHRVDTAWVEGSGDAGASAGIGTSTGASVTWLNPWSTAGGDFQAVKTGTIQFDASPNDLYNSSNLAADVQAWVGGTTNAGWILRSPATTENAAGTTTSSIKWFGTSEQATAGDRPRLTVNFTRDLP